MYYRGTKGNFGKVVKKRGGVNNPLSSVITYVITYEECLANEDQPRKSSNPNLTKFITSR